MKKSFFIFLLCNLFFLTAQNSTEIEKTVHLQDKKTPKLIEINKNKLPIIESLLPSKSNVVFKEYQSIIESNSKAIRAGREPEILFFLYKNTENFTFQALAARCCITQETLATLNQIDNGQQNIKNKEMILPTVNGIFIPSLDEKPLNSLETLLQENYLKTDIQTLTKNYFYYNINGRNYVFLQDKRFSSIERAYFLDSALQLPLDKNTFWVSSEFGKRKNPFSHEEKNHNGIDLAAPEGTPVYAIKDGAVFVCVQDDKEFGNYVILSHDTGKITSVYAHLQSFTVEKYQTVKKGEIIGYVGQTGMVTGPHLHFEIRQGGKPENPRQKLKLDEK